MKKHALNTLALVLGFVVGNAVVTYAQTGVPTFPFGQAIECAFNQPAPSLAEANTMKAGMTFDGSASETVVPLICTGGGSPFQCSFPIPAVNRAVGQHVLIYRVGNTEFDGSVSWDPISETRAYTVTPAVKGAPGHNTGGVIRKLGGTIASLFKALFGWATN
jgi:hypothetical protein